MLPFFADFLDILVFYGKRNEQSQPRSCNWEYICVMKGIHVDLAKLIIDLLGSCQSAKIVCASADEDFPGNGWRKGLPICFELINKYSLTNGQTEGTVLMVSYCYLVCVMIVLTPQAGT